MHELVSVIIPVYNVAPYLREALESVVNQTYRNLEILLIDDGSTDGSGDICDEYATRDSRITVVHQAHYSSSVARNTALDIATGEYLVFLDSDDAFDLSFVQTMLDTILRENCDIVICKYRKYATTQTMKQSVHKVILPSISPGLYNRGQALDCCIDGRINVEIWNKLYKRELWNNLRFPFELYASADTIVTYQVVFNCNSVYVIDTPLYLYRKRSDSLTALFSSKIIRSRVLGMSYVSKFIRSHSPKVFSVRQIQQYDIAKIHMHMNLYLRCSEKDDSNYLKTLIVDLAKKSGIENCSRKTRAEYYMMCHCPRLLKYGYAAYLPIRSFVWKKTGR